MNCAEAREQLLIADLAELDAAQPSALSSHIVKCASCRAVAASIAEDTTALRSRVQRRRASSRRSRLVMLAALPVAAVLIAVVVQARASARHNAVERDAVMQATRSVGVDVSRGQQATVIKTADPKVTVIWLTPGVGE